MTRRRSSQPSTRSGHKLGASVTGNLCRSRTVTACGLRCKPLGGHRSIPKVSHGRETTSTPMEEPAKLFQQSRSVGSNGGTQYVVREAEAERAPEIAGEFYPNGDAACSELAEESIPSNEEDEVIARICELTHQLGYNEAKTKMLLGQWARNLVRLERSLLNELETLPDKSVRMAEEHRKST